MHAVRVLPDVAGLDKLFDYAVPPEMGADVHVGTRVRVDLHGRRIGGWVVAVDVDPPEGVHLRPLAKVTGWGPAADLVELSSWAAWRWAGRRSALLTAASPGRAVRHLPPRPLGEPVGAAPAEDGLAEELRHPGRTVIRLPPGADRMPLIRAALAAGPALVVLPSAAEAGALARRLAGEGHRVAEVPEAWAKARAGGSTVIGARGAAWAPAPGVATMMVLDVHDEVHQDERAPTWHVRDVLGERAARAGVPCVAVSPCPDLSTLDWAEHVTAPGRAVERSGWPIGELVDLREEDPANGLLSSRLAAVVRGESRVLCVLNRKGRARLLACAGCNELARCASCEAAVAQTDEGLACPRCSAVRPVLCLGCGRQRLRTLRPGVSGLRKQLEALVGEPVGEMSTTKESLPDARVVIGTEAVLHRAGRAAVVAFLDFDQELLAPRFRATEQAMALLARAGRLTGGRHRGGRVLVQTRLPDHEVNRALVHGDPSVLEDAERERRRLLGMPPFRAIAAVSGPVAGSFVEGLDAGVVEALGPDDGMWLVRAADHAALCDALAAAPRPPGRLRVEVDPLRI